MKFYRAHYLSAAHAFVHGLLTRDYSALESEYDCRIRSIPTILRSELVSLKDAPRGSDIVGILGGGSRNASESFFRSTVDIARNIIELARILEREHFVICCNDSALKSTLEIDLPSNAELIDRFCEPKEIYTRAKAVICRAGRNTLSELLFLKIPSILYSIGGDFRSAEQSSNIDVVCRMSGGLMRSCVVSAGIEDAKRIGPRATTVPWLSLGPLSLPDHLLTKSFMT